MLTKHHIESKRGFLAQRACVLTKLRMGTRGTVPLRLFSKPLIPLQADVWCQEKLQVVSRLPWILLKQGFLDRSLSVIICVSECSRGNSSAPFLFHGMTSVVATVALK